MGAEGRIYVLSGDTVIIGKMGIRQIEEELQLLRRRFRVIFKYECNVEKKGISIMFNKASQTLADDIGDSG